MDRNTNLLKAERHGQIFTLINQQGRVTVQELSKLFAVSEATIRRDLEELDSQGRISRTHGGAVNAEISPAESPMMQRQGENPQAKAAIGKAAVELIKANDTIFLGSGTTVIEVARNLPPDLPLTVISNSLPVINELAGRADIELIIIGGILRPSEMSLIGHVAEQAVREFRADMVFLGMYGIDLACGFTNDYPPEIMTDRAILSISHQVVILADHSKFGQVSSMLVAPISVADTIITDQGTPGTLLDEFRALGIRVIQA